MNTTKSIIRIAVLFALCALGLLLIFNIGDPNELVTLFCIKTSLDIGDPNELVTLFCIKTSLEVALGIICFIITGMLYIKWSKTDKWLMKYEGWIKEAEEAQL